MSISLSPKALRRCIYCAVQRLAAFSNMTKSRSSETSRRIDELRSYEHVSTFPLPLPKYEKLNYEILRNDFVFVEEYLPVALKPIAPSAVKEYPSGWVPGEVELRSNMKFEIICLKCRRDSVMKDF